MGNIKFYFEFKKYFITEVDQNQASLLKKIFELRYDIYCKQLKWVKSNESYLEFDDYDRKAIHFAVVDYKNNILGTSRILLGGKDNFMVNKEFKILVDKNFFNQIDIDECVEISRLAIKNNYRNYNNINLSIATNLYLAMYVWSLCNKKRYWVIVVEEKFLNYLRNKYFLPIKLLGNPNIYSDGVKAVAALVKIKDLRFVLLFIIKPKLFFIFIKMYIKYGFK